MKNRIRIFLVCFVLIGGTAFFVYHSLNQFNKTLDNLSASSFAIANTPPVPISNKTNKEQIPISTPEIISTPAVSTDLKLSFIFPKENDEIYIGCAYKISFQSSMAIRSLETALMDAGAIKAIEPTESGLARENKIEPNSKSLSWKVGWVWPGKYYIKVSNINGANLESENFTIRKMQKGISADEKEKICKESGGSFLISK